MNESTDTPQIAHLRDLEAKRTAAFDGGKTERQLIAAFYEMTQTHPQWSRITPPIRSNSPRAGGDGWEWESVAPSGRGKLALTVLLVGGAMLAGLVIAGLRWRAGVTW